MDGDFLRRLAPDLGGFLLVEGVDDRVPVRAPNPEIWASARDARRVRGTPAQHRVAWTAGTRRWLTPVAEDRRFQRVRAAISAEAGASGEAVSLQVVCRAAVAHLRVGHPGVTGAAVTVPGTAVPTAQTLGAYGPFARPGEELQVTLGEGPSLEGLTRDGAVLIADLDAPAVQTRWPLFAPTVAAAGVGSMYVVPMGVGAPRFGVFVVYLDRVDVAAPGVVAAEVLADGVAFAEVALDLLLDLASDIVRSAEGDPSAVGWFFDDSPAIHQATGMVSGQLGIDMATAFLRIRACAFAEGRTLSEVAGQVVSRERRFEAD